MELWGFENESSLGIGRSSMLKIKGRGGAGGGGGAAKTDEIPYHVDAVTEADKPASAKVEAGKTQGQAWVAFVAEDPKKAHDVKQLITESKKPPKGTLWSYKVTFTERDEIAGISTKEEAEEVQKAIEDLPDYENLRKKDATPDVFYYKGVDTDNDGKSDQVVLDQKTLSGLGSFVEHGPDKSGKIEGEAEDPRMASPAEYGQSLGRRLDRLDEMGRKIDFLIQELLAAIMGGNTDMILQVVRLFETKTKVESNRVAVILGDAMAKTGRANKEANDKLAKLLSTKDPKNIDHGAIQEARNVLQQNEMLNGIYANMLRDATGRSEEAANMASSIATRAERLGQIANTWR